MGAQASDVHRSRGGHNDVYQWGPEVRRRSRGSTTLIQVELEFLLRHAKKAD
jgi:hypothetical protein